MAGARRWLLAAAWLAGVVVARGQVPPETEATIGLEPTPPWINVVMPPASGDCPAQPFGPHRLPARPSGNWLGLIFADGRQARWDSLSVVGDALYWPLERACHTLGVDLLWDPDLMRGELSITDSLRCAFIVGAEFLHCGPHALQMRAPALYLGNRVLLPLDFLKLTTRGILADRFSFREDSLLLVQRPAPGPTASVISEQVGNRCYFSWKLANSQDVSLSTDGLATITVNIPGLRLDPARPPQPGPRAAGCLWALRPGPEGVAFVLRVDPSVRAWRIQTREQAGELRLELSANASDRYRDRDGYRPWYPPLAVGEQPSTGPVVLVLPDFQRGDLAAAPRTVRSLLRDVAEQVRARLEQSGTPVAVVETAGRANWLRGVGTRQPAACICLLPDLAGHALLPGCRLMTAQPLPGDRPLFPLDRLSAVATRSERGQGGGGAPALRRWEAVAAAQAGNTHRLAWLMQLYLETGFPGGRFERGHWPGALLDGIDAPAVAVYFGEPGTWAAEEPGTVAPGDIESTALTVPERLATAIVGAVLMYLMGAQRG